MFVWCARPTGGSHGLITHDPAQRFKGAKRRPRWKRMGKRGQGQYKGRSPKAPTLDVVREFVNLLIARKCHDRRDNRPGGARAGGSCMGYLCRLWRGRPQDG
jgi:hypothetical protein